MAGHTNVHAQPHQQQMGLIVGNNMVVHEIMVDAPGNDTIDIRGNQHQ
jgi:hypothetical protein